MRSLRISLLLLLAASGALVAQSAERFTPFRLPTDHSRGSLSAIAQLSQQEQVAVYSAVIVAFAKHSGASMPWLEPRFLSSERGYARYDSMPLSLERRLLATHLIRGSCRNIELLPCKAAGGVYTISHIYLIDSGILRVFVAYVANPERGDSLYSIMGDFAAEEVFRVEQRQNKWVVTRHETVMIT
jgi:hypothetical protein